MVDFHKNPTLRNQLSQTRRVCPIVLGGFLVLNVAQAADENIEQSFTHYNPGFVLANVSTESSGRLKTASENDSASDSVSKSRSHSSAMNLFVISGLKELVGHIPASTANSFEAALTAQQLPDMFLAVDQKAIGEAVNNAFKSETFDKYLVGELRTGMSQQAREYMLAWYASPLGTRVKQAEIDNSLLTDHTRFDNYQTLLEHYPADVSRDALIEKLDVTLKSTESAMDMMSSIQVAFNLSLTRFMPEEHRLSRKEIMDMVAQSQDELFSHYEKKTKAVLLFTYQGLNNKDLAKLNETLATDAGQDFVDAINNGIKKGMFAASLDLGDGLGALLDNSPQNSGI